MNERGPSSAIIIVAIVAILIFFGGGQASSAFPLLDLITWMVKTAFLMGFAIVLLIVGVILYYLNKEKRTKKKEEILDRTDPTHNDPHKPENLEKVFNSYRTSVNLGPIARTAIKQKERMEAQKDKYATMLKRRFSEGTLTYTKYMQLEQEYTDAMYNEFLKIANRMIAFDDHEYQMLESGTFKHDSIPDDIQYERLNLYRRNLQEMKDALKHNEQTILAVDQLMIKLADSDYTESGVTEQVDELEKQLEYYKKH